MPPLPIIVISISTVNDSQSDSDIQETQITAIPNCESLWLLWSRGLTELWITSKNCINKKCTNLCTNYVVHTKNVQSLVCITLLTLLSWPIIFTANHKLLLISSVTQLFCFWCDATQWSQLSMVVLMGMSLSVGIVHLGLLEGSRLQTSVTAVYRLEWRTCSTTSDWRVFAYNYIPSLLSDPVLVEMVTGLNAHLLSTVIQIIVTIMNCSWTSDQFSAPTYSDHCDVNY